MDARSRLFLNRLSFGHDAESLANLSALGERGWLEAQLAPVDSDDPRFQEQFARLQIRIKYPESKDWPAVDELRPPQWLDKPIDDLWKLTSNEPPRAGQEKNRPRIEVSMATLLRAAYSRWQLRELLVDFWHNHFNVNAWDQTIGIALPNYDREVIRRHALGNFREMLEGVAQSTAMLCYLNNRSSRAGAPNENWARELFELHTLGRDAYRNALYNRWRDVPGAEKGKPVAYIDQDVYEAARAFTGWALEDGASLGGSQTLPKTGRFRYVEAWHDNYQKRVLASEFDPYQLPLQDGRRVLDLAAFHPATAQFVVGKLCRRLLGEDVPKSLLASASKVWTQSRDKPDQIARVVRHIATAKAFRESPTQKVKRPLELVASYLRATGANFTPSEGLLYELEGAGQRLFGWPTPNGHPDQAAHWLSPNVMRRRWTLLAGLTDNWWQTGGVDALAEFGGKEAEVSMLGRFWLERLYGEVPPDLLAALLSNLRMNPGQRLNNPAVARRLVAWAAMAPAFQRR